MLATWGCATFPKPTLDLNFAGATSLDNRITFTRASTATFFNSLGVLTTANNDVARFTYNPATLAPQGLLIEEQRTNLLLHNRDLTNVAWTASNVTAAKNQIGIDGVANSASLITATDANGTILQAITSASAARATSAYVKRVTGTGTIEMTQDGGTTWTAVTVTSAWTRVSIASATVTNPSVGFRIVTNGDAIAVDGVQLENGAFATSVIPTTTTTLTRNADVASMTGTNFSSWYNQTEGTVLTDFSFVGLKSVAGQRITTIDDGSSTNLIAQSAGSSNTLLTTITTSGSSVMSSSSPATTFSANTQYKMLIAYKENDSVAAVNGTVGTADTSNTIPTVTTLRLAASSAASTANCYYRRIAYYPVRLANAQLQALTQ